MTKALAALVAGWLIYRELGRRGRDPELAYSLTLWGVVAGFAGAKLFYLAEHLSGASARSPAHSTGERLRRQTITAVPSGGLGVVEGRSTLRAQKVMIWKPRAAGRLQRPTFTKTAEPFTGPSNQCSILNE